MLEISHFHLFAMGMLLLVLTHLMLFVPLADRTKAVADHRCRSVAALLDEGSGWLVRFVHPGFAYAEDRGLPRCSQASLAALIVLSLWAVFSGSQRPTAATTVPRALERRAARRARAAARLAPGRRRRPARPECISDGRYVMGTILADRRSVRPDCASAGEALLDELFALRRATSTRCSTTYDREQPDERR